MRQISARGYSPNNALSETGTMQNLDELSSEILSAVEAADTTDALEAVRIDALGKKGRISVMMRELGGMDPEERKAAGQRAGACGRRAQHHASRHGK